MNTCLIVFLLATGRLGNSTEERGQALRGLRNQQERHPCLLRQQQQSLPRLCMKTLTHRFPLALFINCLLNGPTIDANL